MALRVVLASASPRRRELLASLGMEFEVVVPEVDETPLPEEPPWACATRLAKAKARAVPAQYPRYLTLAADTVVALGQRLFNKPANAAEARWMLEQLSGQTHTVWTAVCLAREDRVLELFADVSRVRFRRLSAEEIAAYVASGEGFDKAGAYAAQGLGRDLIERIEGSVSNVIGLPVEELQRRLARHLPEGTWRQVPPR